jgi:peptidoglycan/LPS O-acetylase OafA/YrhL
VTSRPPPAVRRAGALVAAEGVAAVVFAAVLVALAFAHHANQRVAFGTAAWFAIVGVAVLAAGWALRGGRRWGRGLAVVAQLLLLPVAWSMAISSRQPAVGIPVAVVALGTLALLFSPSALRWATRDPRYEPASADSSDPDTR